MLSAFDSKSLPPPAGLRHNSIVADTWDPQVSWEASLRVWRRYVSKVWAVGISSARCPNADLNHKHSGGLKDAVERNPIAVSCDSDGNCV